MTQIKYILVFTVLIIAIFILCRLYEYRVNIIMREGMSAGSSDYAAIMSDIANVSINPIQLPCSILNSSQELMSVPINQFFIKASYNSSYSGNYVSDEMLKYICSRGCRFLDFEVYYLLDSSTGTYNSYVGYSNDPAAVSPTIKNKDNITFQYMLQKALDYSFSNGAAKCPNYNDPLFIKIRPKVNNNDLANLMSLINNDILYSYNNGYKSYFYCSLSTKGAKRPIGTLLSSKTTLGDINKKVIFIFNEDYSNTKFLSEDTSENNDSVYYNLTSAASKDGIGLYGTTYIHYNNQHPMPPIQKTITTTVNIKDLYEVYPDDNITAQPNPDIFSIIPNYGYQIVEMQYYSSDIFLLVYENLFNNYSSGLVPITYCMSFTRLYGGAREMNLGIKSFMKTGGIDI